MQRFALTTGWLVLCVYVQQTFQFVPVQKTVTVKSIHHRNSVIVLTARSRIDLSAKYAMVCWGYCWEYICFGQCCYSVSHSNCTVIFGVTSLVDSLSAVCGQGPLNNDAVRVCAAERLLEQRERESGGRSSVERQLRLRGHQNKRVTG